jgi:hypothetical protein
MPVAQFSVTTAARLRAIVVVAGALRPGAGQEAFQLLIVDTSAPQWTVARVIN